MNKKNIFTATMSSNIALIKYMGKKNSKSNIPINASLSYTLDNLTTTVILKKINHHQHLFKNNLKLKLSLSEKNKFIAHLEFLKKYFNKKDFYEISSENNFPSHCGLASSASSFAALTACAIKAFKIKKISAEEMANLSRLGSGSSCRSFFSPFATWNKNKISPIKLPYKNLIHQVIVVSQQKKLISSRDAHQLVQTSLLFSNRKKRAELRLENLLQALSDKNWPKSYEIIWQEFQDMHALFETCEKPFGYLLPESILVLNYLRNYWENNSDGPLVTMDAGPNIHLLYRPDQKLIAESIKKYFNKKFLVL